VRRFDETVRLDRLLPEMDLGVGHGSFGVASALVSAGVPQLALPRHAEQLMTARALGEAGCGIGFAGEPSAAQISKAMRKLIERPEYRANARALSEKRREMDCAASAAAVANGLLGLA
jgi:Glycosyl transferases, related to UDP-glucuronosyltransferase